MVLRQQEYHSRTAGKIGVVSHYVVEVNIRHVLATEPGKGNTGDKGDRVVDDVTRIITKAGTLSQALHKAERLLAVEGEDFEEHSQASDVNDITGPNFLVGDAMPGER